VERRRFRSFAGCVASVVALLFSVVGSAGPAQSGAAGPSTFEGVVGKAKVVMLIDTKTWKGAYFYLTSGRDIPLSGSPSGLNEVDPNWLANSEGKVTGQFQGKLSSDGTKYEGTWVSKVSSAKSPFLLNRTGNGTPGSNQKATVTAKITTVKPSGSAVNGDATYRLPLVSGVAPGWIGTRISGRATALAFYDQTLNQTIAEYKKNGYGVTSVNYEVPYNDKGIVNLTILTETSQAYPDHFEHYALFDLRNGVLLTADDLWTKASKPRLVALLQKHLDGNIAEAVADPDSDLTAEMLKDSGNAKVNDETLQSITIQKQGVVFTHQFNFPHAIEAAEPSGTLSLTWSELKPFRSPNTSFASVG
jgi:hypothetical protein